MGGVIVAVLSFVCSVNIFVCKSCSESQTDLELIGDPPDLIHPRTGILDVSHYSGSVVVLS